MIVRQLHEIQHRHGFLPDRELRSLSDRTGLPLYRLEEVSSFFPHFRREAPPKVEVRICRDMACHLNGGCELAERLEEFKKNKGYTDQQLVVGGASCLGRCDRAPAGYVASVNSSGNGHGEDFRMFTNLDDEKIIAVVGQAVQAVESGTAMPPPDTDLDWRTEQTDPWTIDIYRGVTEDNDRYAAVRQFVKNSVDLNLNLGETPAHEVTAKLDEKLEADLAGPRNLGNPFLQENDPERKRVIAALYTAGLLGMGGAGGRAYKKWFDVRKAAGDEKYIVCNADESEPGTFKDRELLLRSPYLAIEGVIVAGLAVKARRGYIYIRHEYREQIAAVKKEIERAEELGICGDDVLGTGYSFPVEVFESPGGYICGEQTALIEAMEGKRAEPRNRPPELQTNGLWDKPTVLNNVETLSWVPAIIVKDEGRWFSEAGRAGFQGRRFFSISGDVNRPGAYEVPMGVTLEELIEDETFCGGMKDGQSLKAFAPSGPSGGFLPRMLPVGYLTPRFVEEAMPEDADDFDIYNMMFDIALCRQMGIMMGAGLIVYGERADMVREALACLKFYRNESCGKCVPCRVGSQKLVDLATKLAEGKFQRDLWFGENGDDGPMKYLVKELSDTMKLTAICGLGTVASNPLSSLMNHFRDDVEKYLQ